MLNTREIKSSVDQIADFLAIDSSTISLKKSHANKRNKRFKLAEIVDQDYLYQQLETICADFIDRHLPLLSDGCLA